MSKKEVQKNKDVKNDKDNKNKKSFFKGFKAEIKRVIWPTSKQLVNNTIAVISIVLITAIIVFVLDLTFEIINTKGINKIKETILVENKTNNQIVNNTTDNSNTVENTTNNSNEAKINNGITE